MIGSRFRGTPAPLLDTLDGSTPGSDARVLGPDPPYSPHRVFKHGRLRHVDRTPEVSVYPHPSLDQPWQGTPLGTAEQPPLTRVSTGITPVAEVTPSACAGSEILAAEADDASPGRRVGGYPQMMCFTSLTP